MTPGQSCATCAAFNPLGNECRRKSPLATLVPQAPGKMAAVGYYPATQKDGWCCEWVGAACTCGTETEMAKT